MKWFTYAEIHLIFIRTKRVKRTDANNTYRNANKGEIMIITAGYKHDPIKSNKLRMTVYFNVRRLFPGMWICKN